MAEMEDKINRGDIRVIDSDHSRGKKRRRTDSDSSTRGGGLGSTENPLEVDDEGASSNDGPGAEAQGNSWWHVVTDLESLRPGDQAFCSLLGCTDKMQIYSYRGVVQHHGIVVWTPPAELARELTVQELRLAVKVVHFDPSRDGVITTPLQVFLEGGTPRRAFYSASGLASTVDCGATYACERDDPQTIVRRATEAAKFDHGISGWSGYSLLTNNCETFACWCSTGRRNTLSRQATRALVGAGVVAGGVSAAAAASAAASAGGFASLAGVTSAAMIPRGIRQIHSTLKMVEVAVGVATVIGMLSDVVSLKVTRAQS